MATATMAAMELSAADLARLCRARIEAPSRAGADAGQDRLAGVAERVLAGITTDSREVVPGGAFVAVAGQSTDGHAFLAAAGERGAVATLVRDGAAVPEQAPPLRLRVPDTAAALRAACRARLRELGATVVGVTGSVGKTTAKEMTAHVLGDRARATAGNLNTWTGIPLSVLRLDGPVDTFVAELAMTAPGEIADLCRFTEPRIGVLLNVGVSHIELLGSREAIAAAKAELLDALPPDGLAVCNADDALVAAAARARSRAPIAWFGLGTAPADGAWHTARDVVDGGLAGTTFTLVVPGGERRVRLDAPGRHLVVTACAAAAVARARGVDLDSIAARLESFRPVPGRGTVRAGARGALVLDDAYNSAPASLAAGLDLLAASGGAERVAVVGDMLELGPCSLPAHEEAGRRVAAAATLLIAVGAYAERVAAAAVAAGLPPERALVAADAEAAVPLALAACSPAAVVLVKASHGVHLERVVEALTA